jgi:hypothetical protein
MSQYPTPPSYENQQDQFVQQPENNTGLWAMILGILSLVLSLGFITGIPAIIMGKKGMRLAAEGRATNGGQAQAGFILGIIATVLSVLAVIAVVIGVIALGAAGVTTSSVAP